MNDVRCSLPWQSLSVDNQGRTRICCNSDAHYTGTRSVKLSQCASVAEAMDTSYHQEVRASMQQGRRHVSCKKCWDIEDSGGRSFRQIWNQILPQTDDVVPRYLDITLGNKCNLTCRMCNEWNSHLWQIDNLRMGRYTDTGIGDTFWFEDAASRQLLIDALPTATHINFLGGEPLIVNEQLELLAHCAELGRDVELSYNTNMTVLRPRQLALWAQFKRVNLSVSLDGVGAQNDYIRQNSRWGDILHNLEQIYLNCPSVQMTVHATFGVYSALTMHELVKWSDSQPWFGGRLPWLNVVTWPQVQDPRHLPHEAKQLVQQRLHDCTINRELDSSYASYTGAINHMLQDRVCKSWNLFWDDVDQLDAYKQTNIQHSLLELASYRT